jgi:serralysin
VGGEGLDRVTGGAGAYVFVFSLASDSARAKSDKILDFQTGVDKIDLSAIDADTSVAGHQAFVFGLSSAGAASLWISSGYLFGDTNNDNVADMAIYVPGAISHSDFLF